MPDTDLALLNVVWVPIKNVRVEQGETFSSGARAVTVLAISADRQWLMVLDFDTVRVIPTAFVWRVE